MSEFWLIVVLAGILTYLTRIGGYLLIRTVGELPPRLEAALDAVPAAVLTTIFAPVMISGDWPERAALVLCGLLAFRLPLIATVAFGAGFVALARAIG
ncbi:AzlD domain-containing protein [Fulvimarina sp. 2208YS6-2-32]|uniref:AzlD domain-containing protein n=1 Tax=Fulvimarina uroteuthidis TaxID=3098149 RepID=A0ABU5I2M8_9HYPH|nr:AzlD domain-containing protein [Fulvimarina sp. 2208YS6-2-32]MDY8109621.1 AzlD domain-containing protein [Fulvimarina sp. 2208YS6-2-32]